MNMKAHKIDIPPPSIVEAQEKKYLVSRRFADVDQYDVPETSWDFFDAFSSSSQSQKAIENKEISTEGENLDKYLRQTAYSFYKNAKVNQEIEKNSLPSDLNDLVQLQSPDGKWNDLRKVLECLRLPISLRIGLDYSNEWLQATTFAIAAIRQRTEFVFLLETSHERGLRWISNLKLLQEARDLIHHCKTMNIEEINSWTSSFLHSRYSTQLPIQIPMPIPLVLGTPRLEGDTSPTLFSGFENDGDNDNNDMIDIQNAWIPDPTQLSRLHLYDVMLTSNTTRPNTSSTGTPPTRTRTCTLPTVGITLDKYFYNTMNITKTSEEVLHLQSSPSSPIHYSTQSASCSNNNNKILRTVNTYTSTTNSYSTPRTSDLISKGLMSFETYDIQCNAYTNKPFDKTYESDLFQPSYCTITSVAAVGSSDIDDVPDCTVSSMYNDTLNSVSAEDGSGNDQQEYSKQYSKQYPVTPPPNANSANDILKSLLLPQFDYDAFWKLETQINQQQVKVMMLCLETDIQMETLHRVLQRSLEAFRQSETTAERNVQFDEFIARLGDGACPREGFLDWRKEGVQGFRPLAIELLLNVYSMAEMKLQRFDMLSVYTIQKQNDKDINRIAKGGADYLDYHLFTLDRWGIIYNGQDVVHRLLHMLDDFRSCRELSDWFGRRFQFLGNPLMLPFDLFSCIEALDLKEYISFHRGRTSCSQDETDDWRFEKFLIRFKDNFEHQCELTRFGNWPADPVLKTDGDVYSFYKAVLVLFVRCGDSMDITSSYEKRFLLAAGTLRGKHLLIGESGVKVEKKLDIPIGRRGFPTVLLDTCNNTNGDIETGQRRKEVQLKKRTEIQETDVKSKKSLGIIQKQPHVMLTVPQVVGTYRPPPTVTSTTTVSNSTRIAESVANTADAGAPLPSSVSTASTRTSAPIEKKKQKKQKEKTSAAAAADAEDKEGSRSRPSSRPSAMMQKIFGNKIPSKKDLSSELMSSRKVARLPPIAATVLMHAEGTVVRAKMTRRVLSPTLS